MTGHWFKHNDECRPFDLFVTARPGSDYIGARALLSSLPDAGWLPGNRGHDASWFREALKDKEIPVCVPVQKRRKKTAKCEKRKRTPNSDRDHRRQAQGLEARGDPLR